MQAFLTLLVGMSIFGPFAHAQLVTQRVVESQAEDHAETTIAMNPANPLNLVIGWNDFRSDPDNVPIHPGYAFSLNGGTSWLPQVLTGSNAAEPNHGGFDPAFAFDSNGNAYFCYVLADQNLQTDLGRVFVSKSTDNGGSWSHTQVSSAAKKEDKPFVAIDNTGGAHAGNIYVAWVVGDRILFRRSLDGGQRFSDEQIIASSAGQAPPLSRIESLNDFSAGFVQGPVLAVGPNGELYIAYLETDGEHGSSGRIKVRKSTDGGAPDSFSSPVTALPITVVFERRNDPPNPPPFGIIRSASIPTMAVDQNNGNVYAAAISSDGGNYNIHFARSTDGGTTWEPDPDTDPPLIPTEGSANRETFPSLAVDDLGHIYLAYYTDRNAPDSKVDVYLTRSTDGGVSFETPNVRVSPNSSDPRALVDPNAFSDYIGLTAKGQVAYVAWADFQNNNADIYFATVDYTQPTSVCETPPAPADLYIQNAGSIGANPILKWTGNHVADYYKIFRRVSFDPQWLLLDSTSAKTYVDNTLTIQDPNDPDSEEFLYQVTAVNDCGQDLLESAPSNTASVWGFSFFKQADDSGKESAIHRNIPEQFRLGTNYPNPFNPATTIPYELPHDAFVTIRISNIMGNAIRTLFRGPQNAGYHTIEWDGKNNLGKSMASGIYLVHFEAITTLGSNKKTRFVQTQKIAFVK